MSLCSSSPTAEWESPKTTAITSTKTWLIRSSLPARPITRMAKHFNLQRDIEMDSFWIWRNPRVSFFGLSSLLVFGAFHFLSQNLSKKSCQHEGLCVGGWVAEGPRNKGLSDSIRREGEWLQETVLSDLSGNSISLPYWSPSSRCCFGLCYLLVATEKGQQLSKEFIWQLTKPASGTFKDHCPNPSGHLGQQYFWNRGVLKAHLLDWAVSHC